MKFLLGFCGKKPLFILIVTSLAILILDLIGIALIFPFLKLFIAPDTALHNQYVNTAYEAMEFESVNKFVYTVGLFLIVAYLLKLIIKTISNAIKYHVFADLTYRLSQHLFKGLLQARYTLFTDEGASEMIGVINGQTAQSVICLESFVKMLNEFLFLVVILGIMFYIDTAVTIWAVVLFIALGVVLYYGLVKRIELYGKTHSRLNVLVYKYGYAVANSIKDIKIMRLEKKNISKFSEIWREYSRNDSRSKVMQGIPSDLSETLIFSGIVLACLYLLMSEQNTKDMIPFLGVLAVGAMRLLPSFNRIISGYNTFRFYKPSLSLVEDLDRKINDNRQHVEHLGLPFSNALEVKALSFRYAEKTVLDSISLTLKRGKSLAFVGASGAGKSTLLDILVGLREPATGEFYLDGIQFNPFKTDALRNYIGYVPQNVNLIDESVAFNISFDKHYDEENMHRAVTIARLEEFISGLPSGLDTIMGENGVRVSGGQKQRIGIARALYRDPEILVFDEATSALDTVTERKLMREINQLSKNKTLIIVAHRLSTVENCDVIHLLENGKIISQGTHGELLKSSKEYQELYYQQEQIP
ncbi:MAG: ABC transporter ATP-binding protein/permease [Gammaproteobacteria bacterium]|nr:ABC transporter ATP-binding protein/permease [Gammaproteobacteria bacterium]